MSYSFCVVCESPPDTKGHVGYKECDRMLEEMGYVLRKHGYDPSDSYWEVER